MDPQQTWTDMLDALKQRQWDDANELAGSLYEWIRKGGFPPTTVGDGSLGKRWHKTIASFTCFAVANRMEQIRECRKRRQSHSKGGD